MSIKSLLKKLTDQSINRVFGNVLHSVIREELQNVMLLRPLLDSLLDSAPWCVSDVTLNEAGNEISIQGWAFAPKENYSPVTFTINDIEFDHVAYPIHRSDIGSIFWFRPNSEWSAFSCKTYIDPDKAFSNGVTAFKFCDKRTLRPLREEHNVYYIDPRFDPITFPEDKQRKRVHGSEHLSSFIVEGGSTYIKLEQALERACNKGFRDFSDILDWGCGCGRVSRYFYNCPNIHLTGVDIDSDNVRWCQENLTFGDFYNSPLYPPMQLDSSSFDLLIGISIFTHLKESEQFAWLEELRRVAQKGAILLMTVQSDFAVCSTPMGFGQIVALKQAGFIGGGQNHDLDGQISDASYYTNSIHTREYIVDRWSKYFEILEIIPTYIGNMQDLVVMRKS